MVAVVPLFPTSENEIEDFESVDCHPSGEVNLIDDEESGILVIDIIGEDSRINFFGTSSHPLIAIHVNCSNRFFTIVIHVRDDANKDYVFELSNKRSTITIENNICKLPLEVGEGWQRLCINMEDILLRAFGSTFALSTKITFIGSCRLAKLFYQSDDYSDPELPSFLRVATSDVNLLK